MLRPLPTLSGDAKKDVRALWDYLADERKWLELDRREVPGGITTKQSGVGDLVANLGVPWELGQCRLTKSGSNLLLSPHKGNRLLVNNRFEVIPDAGVSLAPSGLSASTTYYIYALMDRPGGTTSLEASTTTHATQAGTGCEIKSGDGTRTLVGMARTTAGVTWVDTEAQRFTLSWFNRRALSGSGAFTASRSTTSVTFVELNAEIRNEFLTWSDQAVWMGASGDTVNSGVSGSEFSSLGIDDAAAEDVGIVGGIGTTNFYPFGLSHVAVLAEGYHYVTLLGKVDSGTGTWRGGSVGTRATVKSIVRG